MKTALILLFFLFSAAILDAQVINGGFEEWDGSAPAGWSGEGNKGIGHSGNYCFHWYKSYYGAPEFSLPFLRNTTNFKIPFGKSSLTFWYKAKTVGGNSSVILVKYIFFGGMASEPLLSSDQWRKGNVASVIEVTNPTASDSIYFSFCIDYEGSTNVDFDFEVDDVMFETQNNDVSGSNLQNTSISISPNPISSHAHLNLHLNAPASIHAAIYDVTGREVLLLPSLELASGDERIPFDVDEIPNGMYYVRCEVGSDVTMLKVIVQH